MQITLKKDKLSTKQMSPPPIKLTTTI